MPHWAVGVAAAAVATILFVSAFTAQGTPGAPTATLSNTINPASAQALQVTFTSRLMSLQFPNSIDLLGGHFLYSITETGPANGAVVIAQSQTVAFNVANQSGSTYTVAATVAFTTAVACAGNGCTGSLTENLTMSVQVILGTYWGGALSPTSHIVFSSNANYQSVPPLGSAPSGLYESELLGPLLAGGGIAMLAVSTYRPDTRFMALGIAATVIGLLLISVGILGRGFGP